MAKPVGRDVVKHRFVPRNEQIVLSAMMKDADAMRRLTAALSPDLFLQERHRTIFRTLASLVERRLDFDVETFEQLATGKKYGGRKYVRELCDAFPEGQRNLEYHVEAMKVDAVKASILVGPLQELTDLLEDPTSGLEEIKGAYRSLNSSFANYTNDRLRGGPELSEAYRRRFRQRIQSSPFVPTGIEAFDRISSLGLSMPGLSVWTGQTGMGKSTVAWNIADHAISVLGLNVIYFNLEMETDWIIDGMVSARTGIPISHFVKHTDKLGKKDIKLISAAADEILGADNLKFHRKRIKVEEIEGVIADFRPQLCIFDLWERMVSPPTNEVITDKLAIMESLAAEYRCHMMLLHQQKRPPGNVTDLRPTLNNLKNSGAYGEFADSVIGLHREKYYYKEEVSKDVLELELLKERRGENAGVACVQFDGAHGRIGKEVKGWLDSQRRFI